MGALVRVRFLSVGRYNGTKMKAMTLLDGAVRIDPDILGGAPVFSGTRVPVENLFDFISGGYDLDGFLEKFPRVRKEHAQRVLREGSSAVVEQLSKQAA
jgi:uncharacterized protein (DUF433 family)